jgi:hypothetical protein
MMFRTSRNGLQTNCDPQSARKSAGSSIQQIGIKSPGAALEQNGSPASRAAEIVAAILAAIEETLLLGVAAIGKHGAQGGDFNRRLPRLAAWPCIAMG